MNRKRQARLDAECDFYDVLGALLADHAIEPVRCVLREKDETISRLTAELEDARMSADDR